ncbi:MAG TPA: prepilin-type N-terminal cleavage/methylation domain-containing protein [Rhodocyclaceae bacterium]|nr:prepilin-type N-terminal cleavage/methylation domain-containing protein [Rhodocyclaceae bacterium]
MSPSCHPTDKRRHGGRRHAFHTPGRNRLGGLTLIELMIAMVIGLGVAGAAGQLFISSRIAYTEMERLSTLHEHVRFATDILTRDIRSAAMRSDGSIDVGWTQQDEAVPLEIGRPAASGCDGGLADADGLVMNRYTLAGGNLRCNTAGASPQALISGVRGVRVCAIHAGHHDCGGAGTPVALRITLLLESRAGGQTFEHSVTFTVAMRNAVLALYNAG